MKRKFLLTEAEAMAPYVRTVLADVAEATAKFAHWDRKSKQLAAERTPEQGSVYIAAMRERDWAAGDAETGKQELSELGVRVLDAVHGVAGFPFRWSKSRRSRRIRQAFFLIMLEDDPARGIHTWRFCGEDEVRRVPPHWLGQMESPIVAEVGA